MSEESTFDIVFTGEILEGFVLLEVKQKAAQLFKMDEQKVAALFQSKPVTLKKNLAPDAAKKYQKVLSQIGMAVVAQPQNTEVKGAAAPSPSQPSNPNVASDDLSKDDKKKHASKEVTVPEWELDEVGVLLTEPVEQASAVVNAPDYTLANQPCNILRPDEVSQPPPEPVFPELSELTINDAGEDLLESTEKQKPVDANIDVEHIAAQDVGADLLNDDEKRVILPKQVNTDNIQLAD